MLFERLQLPASPIAFYKGTEKIFRSKQTFSKLFEKWIHSRANTVQHIINDALHYIKGRNTHYYSDDNTLSIYSGAEIEVTKSLEKRAEETPLWLLSNSRSANAKKIQAIFPERIKKYVGIH